jgi:division protein CdvB (Snf7/Vps24/ESCRT-III family)
MNRAMNLPATQRVMMEFQKQSEAMNMKEEMMGDTIDDALGDEDDEEESDALVKEVRSFAHAHADHSIWCHSLFQYVVFCVS